MSRRRCDCIREMKLLPAGGRLIQILLAVFLYLAAVEAFGPVVKAVILSQQVLATIPRLVSRGRCGNSDPPHSSCHLRDVTTKTKAFAAENEDFPGVALPSPSFLTVVIPAYNEQDRIGTTLRAYQNYLKQHEQWGYGGRSSIIVVDDGSTDQTAAVVQKIASSSITVDSSGAMVCAITCLSLSENRGKGGAIAAGIAKIIHDRRSVNVTNGQPQSALSGLILTADADGSADPSCVEALYEELLKQRDDEVTVKPAHNDQLWQIPALVCGYRAYDLSNEQARKSSSPTSPVRQLFHWGFRTTVRILFWGTSLTKIQDTQCGSKLLTLEAARQLYTNLHLQRWSHDVEVLWRAVHLGFPIIGQAPVRWRDCAGSRLAAEGIVRVALTMLLEIVYCRVAYAVGWWRVEPCVEEVD